MKHGLYITRTILVASFMVFLLILPGLSQAEDLVKGTMVIPEVSSQGIEQMAVESVQDNLKACLGRILLDTSVGQQMLAEQSCQQIEGKRKEAQLTF